MRSARSIAGYLKWQSWEYKAMRHLFIGLIFFILAIVLLSLPDQFEGPVLIPISLGHALSVLDTVAMVPLLCGTVFMQLFLWRRRTVLTEQFKRNVPIGILVTFAGGFGLGLLVASAFSFFLVVGYRSRSSVSRLLHSVENNG